MKNVALAALGAVTLVACDQSGSPEAGGGNAAGLAGSGAAPSSGQIAFSNDDERILYSLGLLLGENIGEFSLTAEELQLVTAGMRDVVTESPYQVELETYGPQIQGFVVRREQEAGAEFAAQVAAEPGAEQTASGLIYVPVADGDGAMPVAGDSVQVHYVGTLRDGTVFDSSRERGTPATFALEGVIPCWTEGVQKIQVGGTSRLVCPSDLAYGDTGSPPVIPPGATLLFEVELLDIVE